MSEKKLFTPTAFAVASILLNLVNFVEAWPETEGRRSVVDGSEEGVDAGYDRTNHRRVASGNDADGYLESEPIHVDVFERWNGGDFFRRAKFDMHRSAYDASGTFLHNIQTRLNEELSPFRFILQSAHFPLGMAPTAEIYAIGTSQEERNGKLFYHEIDVRRKSTLEQLLHGQAGRSGPIRINVVVQLESNAVL